MTVTVDIEALIHAAAILAGFLAGASVAVVLYRTQGGGLGSRMAWKVVAFVFFLFAVRGASHVVDHAIAAGLRQVTLVAAALLLPFGLYYVLNASDPTLEGVTDDAR